MVFDEFCLVCTWCPVVVVKSTSFFAAGPMNVHIAYAVFLHLPLSNRKSDEGLLEWYRSSTIGDIILRLGKLHFFSCFFPSLNRISFFFFFKLFLKIFYWVFYIEVPYISCNSGGGDLKNKNALGLTNKKCQPTRHWLYTYTFMMSGVEYCWFSFTW